jgi:DNA-binding CsgD family transcriptional regulator
MSSSVRESDLGRILDVVAAAADAPALDWGLPAAVLEQLAALVPCDMVSFCEFDVAARRTYGDQDWAAGDLTTTPDTQDNSANPFFVNYWESLSCSYPSRTGDERSITTISDFYTTHEWHQTRMFAECFRDMGFPFDREVMCCLPTPGTRTRRVLFFRAGGPDFDDRDRIVLGLLRPHLAELHQDLERERSAVPDLTARQMQLLQLVAAGHTNAQIAAALYVSVHTVRKHLENIFQRLQVTSRTAAVARAFPEGVSGETS